MLARISTLALGFLVATSAAANPFEAKKSPTHAKAAYTNKLMRGAVPTENSQLRRLDEEEEYEIDISGYSIKFDKCQFVRAYDDEVAEDEDMDTVLATKRFVIFRLCPSDSCSSCSYGYGEYLVDMDEYLAATIEYQQQVQEEMCNECEENCYYEDAGDDNERRLARKLEVDCETCQETCEKIENMEENGYIDATAFVECQEIQEEGDDGVQLFAGAMCASNGAKIKIGVFADEYCSEYMENLDVQDFLADGDGEQMKLSHALLKTTYADDCISCLVVDEEEEDNGDDEKEPEVTEVCEQLYEAAAKCEKTHGFDSGFADYAAYENQLANEEIVCDFISSLKSNTYSQDGEIVVGGISSYSEGGSSTT